jgi:hypothetical protein
MDQATSAVFGNSENAVKTQIWIAISIYVLVTIVRRRLGLKTSLYQLLQILSLTLFGEDSHFTATSAIKSAENLLDSSNQLNLCAL